MTKIPIIGGTTEQKLVISFKKQEDNTGAIEFYFEPDITEAVSPEQQAAVNVANTVIRIFNLDNEEQINAESTDTVQ